MPPTDHKAEGTSGLETGRTLRLPNDGKHDCPKNACTRRVSPQYFACRAHWMQVRPDTRAAIYGAYNAGDWDLLAELHAEGRQQMNSR